MPDSPSIINAISDVRDARIAALEALWRRFGGALEALLAQRDVALAEARAKLLRRDLLIETMRVQLARLRRMQFGASSEKLNAEIAQLELALEELEAAAAPVAQTSSVPPKPDRPASVRALPAHLPREDVVAEPPSRTCTCPDCGGALRKLGGERAAAIYTVIETCKMNGVEPQAYIADIIAKIAADWPASRWDELMPWNWQASEERARLAA